MSSEVILEKTRHRDVDAFRVKHLGRYIGFIIQGRRDFTYVLTNKNYLPRSWMAAPQPTAEQAIAKLIMLDRKKEDMLRQIVKSIESGQTIIE